MEKHTFDAKNTVFLIDGSSLLYRGYYGVKPLHAPNGQQVQAIYLFLRMLKNIENEFHPERLIVVWDSKGKTDRHTTYPAYKATRQSAPSDIFVQKDMLVELLHTMQIAQINKEGVEADDLLYSLAKDFSALQYTVVVMSSDKDLGQLLIMDRLFLYDPMKKVMYDAARFAKKIGYPIEKMSFFYSLTGDSSDNIPGVRGIGPKGALQLVNTFDSLDVLYDGINSIKQSKLRTALLTYKNDAYVSHDLFLLRYFETKIDIKSCAYSNAVWQRGQVVFRQLGFASLINEAVSHEKKTVVEKIVELKKKYLFTCVTTVKELCDVVQTIEHDGVCAFDTETTGRHPLESLLVGISITSTSNKAWYIPCMGLHNTQEQMSLFQQSDEKALLTTESVKHILMPLFANERIRKIAHNAKFDIMMLVRNGIPVLGPLFDTMVAAKWLDEREHSVGLKQLIFSLFNEEMITYDDIVTQQGYTSFEQVPIDQAVYYAANDACQTYRLWELYQEALDKKGLTELYNTLEMPLIPVLVAMETEGIKVDVLLLKDFSQTAQAMLTTLDELIYRMTPSHMPRINLNSPSQVQYLLFNELGLTPRKKTTKKSGYSTDAESLRELLLEHPIIPLIIRYREISKLKNSFLDALVDSVNKVTGHIHTTFSQTRVATGRLASSEPNLQNIPVGAVDTIVVREAFVADAGCTFISADYSQIELRVLAHLSGDSALINVFKNDGDVHIQTASSLFGVDPLLVSHQQRQVAKRINFSVLYGLTPYGLAKDLSISIKEATHFIETYFNQYPGIRLWMDTVIVFAKEHGYVATAGGRRRYIPNIFEKNNTLYQEAYRIAINTVVQGTAAEIMKQGMVSLHGAFLRNTLKAKLLLQIHDEVLLSAREEDAESTIVPMREYLEQVVSNWAVPLKVTIRIGKNWHEVTKE